MHYYPFLVTIHTITIRDHGRQYVDLKKRSTDEGGHRILWLHEGSVVREGGSS